MNRFFRILTAAVSAALALSMLLTACTPAPVTPEPTAEPTAEPTRVPKENVAKVILILGQSNAVGATLYEPLRTHLGKDKYKELTKGYENIRHAYFCEAGGKDGVNSGTNVKMKKKDTFTVENLFDKTKLGQSWTSVMFGPEVGLAEYLNVNCPGETFYIIKVAKGAVSIKSSWQEGGYCYEKMKETVGVCFETLEKEGYTPEIISICWMQGEDEGASESESEKYGEYQAELMERLRTLYAQYAPYGGIPVVDAGISSNWKYYKNVNNAKREYAETSELNYYFDTMELGYTYDKEPKGGVDYAHFDSDCVWLLGQKFGEYVVAAYEKVK